MNVYLVKLGQLEEEQWEFEKDYGFDDVFCVLKGKCISGEVGEYDYEFCWFDKII